MTLLELAEALVAIPSHEDETAAGDVIEDWLRAETDAKVTRDAAGNVLARRGSGESLALVGHHDVVPPDETQVDEDGAYDVYERDGRLYGRGTSDMKGALAAMLLAFRAAVPAGELVFASFVGEETGGRGARHAVGNGFDPDYAVVAEGSTGYSAPGVTDVAVAHKGRRALTVEATGESAHASEVDAGDNAIYRACDAVEVLRSIEPTRTTVLGQELAGSVAATEISGGTAWNVVPDSCTVTVDERTVPGERAAIEHLEAIDGVTVAVDQDLPPMACDEPAFADAVLDAARTVQDGAPRAVVKPHATDAGWLSAAGTTCVVCGPAGLGEAHTATESVSIDALTRCREVYLTLAERWPG